MHVPRLASGTRPEERQPSLTSLARARLGARASAPSSLCRPRVIPSPIQNHYNRALQLSLCSVLGRLGSHLSLALARYTLHSREPFTRLSRPLTSLGSALICSHPASRLTLACPPARLTLAASVTLGKPTLPQLPLPKGHDENNIIHINQSVNPLTPGLPFLVGARSLTRNHVLLSDPTLALSRSR